MDKFTISHDRPTRSFLGSNENCGYTMVKTTLAKCRCGHYRIFHLATGRCDNCNCQKYHELAYLVN